VALCTSRTDWVWSLIRLSFAPFYTCPSGCIFGPDCGEKEKELLAWPVLCCLVQRSSVSCWSITSVKSFLPVISFLFSFQDHNRDRIRVELEESEVLLLVRLAEVSSSFGCRVGYCALRPVGSRCFGRDFLEVLVSLRFPSNLCFERGEVTWKDFWTEWDQFVHRLLFCCQLLITVTHL